LWLRRLAGSCGLRERRPGWSRWLTTAS
jgi:hypothetical protein